MSSVNIKRLVDNIRANTTVYTPISEVVVNAIQAIDETGRRDGKIHIRVMRGDQTELEGGLPEVTGFTIEDNGVGFNESHRDSFDTLYSDRKIQEGSKGFGRFTALKYFEDLEVKSIFFDGTTFRARSFSMGKGHNIVVNEKNSESSDANIGSTVSLKGLKNAGTFEKKLSTIAKNLVEKLLPYFITKEYACPTIVLSEEDGGEVIALNDFVNNQLSAIFSEIQVSKNSFQIESSAGAEDFSVRIFKIYSPRNQKSRISLVAHKREVSGSVIHKYIPEFVDEFYEKNEDGENDSNRNYIIKAYVFGEYLDKHVSLERGGFEFGADEDLVSGIGQSQIESGAAKVARDAMGVDITLRKEKKLDRVRSYVDEEAPWHKDMLSKIDLNDLPYNPTKEDIEIKLQREKFSEEVSIRRDVAKLMAEGSLENAQESVAQIVSKISNTGKNDLIHYIALRRNVLDLFGKSLQIDKSGKYSSEGVVHDIIFPRKTDTETLPFKEHNLWMIDERLNFTEYVSSDNPLNGGNSERPDLLAYNKRVVFRGDNEASNPITIFEFKKPLRDDFVNPSSKEDPIQQIVRYVNDIQDGKYLTPEGRKVLVANTTPFYGYVICDISPKMEQWLKREKDFKPMPDGLGWFDWKGNINLYIEVISWDKLLKDATMRNKVFFNMLGI